MKQTLKLLQLVIVFAALSLPTSLYAKKKGTESGGGGGVVWIGKNPVLMDYFTIYKSVDEIPKSLGETSIANSETHLNIEKDLAAKKALNILQGWKRLPYDVMSANLFDAFNVPVWTFVDSELSAPPFYMAPSIPFNAPTSVAAFYYKNFETSEVEVKISREIWNQLPLNDQSGLLIHEGLRQVQIGYKNDYDDETLQRATAIYLICKPSRRLNYYMYFLLKNSPEAAQNVYGSFDDILAKSCERKQ